MKYLFINSVAGYGSTGKLAADQCRSLEARGHSCVLAWGRYCVNCEDISTRQIGTALDQKLHGAATRLLDAQGLASRRATGRFLQWADAYDPDVLWLHNIHGYYLNYELLFAWIRKRPGMKVYWTLHDCWSFTGHCAHFDFAGCERWKSGCHDCPQKKEYPASLALDGSRRNYERKKRAFTGLPDMTLVAPSQWLAGLVKESFLGEYPVKTVHNTIDTEIFRPTPGDFREKYGLQNRKLLMAAASIWGERKGFGDLIKLAGLLDRESCIVLVGALPDGCGGLPDNVLHIDRTDSPRALAEIYTAADVFINTTYEDTYPTVNLEALACGTPVITYRTGGSPESLDERCGAVVDRSPEALWRAIQTMHFRREDCLERSRQLNRKTEPF